MSSFLDLNWFWRHILTVLKYIAFSSDYSYNILQLVNSSSWDSHESAWVLDAHLYICLVVVRGVICSHICNHRAVTWGQRECGKEEEKLISSCIRSHHPLMGLEIKAHRLSSSSVQTLPIDRWHCYTTSSVQLEDCVSGQCLPEERTKNVIFMATFAKCDLQRVSEGLYSTETWTLQELKTYLLK